MTQVNNWFRTSLKR